MCLPAPGFATLLLALTLAPQESVLVPEPFPAAEYAARRARLYERIGPALALVQGAPDVRGFDVFRQSNQFFYLCGIETPGSYLLLDGRSRTATLYLPQRDEERERNEGRRLSFEDAEEVRRASGVERVRPVELLAADFKWTLVPAPPLTLYVPHSSAEGARTSRDELVAGNAHIASDPWDGRPSREGQLLHHLRTRFPQFELRDLTPHLDALRSVKSPRELERLRPIVTDRWEHPSDIFDRHLYQKGAAVLHMLRDEIGDEAFFTALSDFLHRHALGSASTADFVAAAETASGRDLGDFFEQWLYRPGHPVLDVSWSWNEERLAVELRVEQVQDRGGGVPVFRFPVRVAVGTPGGTRMHRLEVDEALEVFSLPCAEAPSELRFDDGKVLLAEFAAGPGGAGPAMLQEFR